MHICELVPQNSVSDACQNCRCVAANSSDLDFNLLKPNMTSPRQSNCRAGGWRTAGGDTDGTIPYIPFFWGGGGLHKQHISGQPHFKCSLIYHTNSRDDCSILLLCRFQRLRSSKPGLFSSVSWTALDLLRKNHLFLWVLGQQALRANEVEVATRERG